MCISYVEAIVTFDVEALIDRTDYTPQSSAIAWIRVLGSEIGVASFGGPPHPGGLRTSSGDMCRLRLKRICLEVGFRPFARICLNLRPKVDHESISYCEHIDLESGQLSFQVLHGV